MKLNLDNKQVQRLLEMDKQTLVDLYLRDKMLKLRYNNEAEWLDQLADLLRDMPEDFNEQEQEIREDFEETQKKNKKLENQYFIDIEKLFVEENPTLKEAGFLVDDKGEPFGADQGDIWIYDSVEVAQEDGDENFEGRRKGVAFCDLNTNMQWQVIDQLREERDEEH